MINVPEHPDELPKYAKVAALELLGRTPRWLRFIFYYGIFGSIPSYEIEGITESSVKNAERFAAQGLVGGLR